MTNAAFGKKVLAIAVLACLCAALIAVPAYGFYYVHDDSVSDSSDGLGSYEVFMVVDETAVGGDVHSDLMFVPAGSTADVVLTEGIISSENQNGLDATHNYDVQSVADYLAANGYNAEISVYPTGEQQAYKDAEGAYAATSQNVSEAYTAPAKGDGSTVLDRYDNVVITVTQSVADRCRAIVDQRWPCASCAGRAREVAGTSRNSHAARATGKGLGKAGLTKQHPLSIIL